jgi:hypothetical protein
MVNMTIAKHVWKGNISKQLEINSMIVGCIINFLVTGN